MTRASSSGAVGRRVLRLLLTWALPRAAFALTGFYALALAAWSLIGDAP